MLDPRWEMLVTYADTAKNHNGGLYRASNWNYHGMTAKNPIFWDNVNNRMVSRKCGPNTYSKKQMIAMGYEHKGNYAKHKFIYPTNNRKRLIIKPKSKELDYVQLQLFFTKEGLIKN